MNSKLFVCLPLSALGIVRSPLCFCLNSRTELQLVVMLQDIFKNLAVLWLSAECHLCRREHSVLGQLKDSHPERLLEEYRQHTVCLAHIIPS